MPFSMNVFDLDFLEFIRTLDPKPMSFLDIGAGAGKYGAIIKKQFDKLAVVTAVEINKEYIEKYKLAELYDTVISLDAVKIPDMPGAWNYDVVILGDVIEHMRKSYGRDLVEFFLYRAAWVWVVYPPTYQQIDQDQRSENHRSLWDVGDFPEKFVHEHQTKNGKHLVILKGLK